MAISVSKEKPRNFKPEVLGSSGNLVVVVVGILAGNTQTIGLLKENTVFVCSSTFFYLAFCNTFNRTDNQI